MQETICCDGRKYLVELYMEIFKGKNENGSIMKSNDEIFSQVIKQIAEMRQFREKHNVALHGLQEKYSPENTKELGQRQPSNSSFKISQKLSHQQNFQKIVAVHLRPLYIQIQKQSQTWKRKYEKSLEQLKDVSLHLDNMKKMCRYKVLFTGQIFDENENHKEILIRHIQSKGGKKINKTRLLYRFDPLNSTNFHKYIDNIKGIALIVKSKKGFYLGAYYSGKMEPQKILDQFALLISISNDASYPLKGPERTRIIRAVIYDELFVIFGNADIRLAPGRDCIFSNFGKSASFYTNEGKKTIDFLGEQNQQIQIQTYQFYQVRVNNEA